MKKLIIIIIIATGFFMESLDSTALNTALPQIAFSFHINPIHLKIAITSYLLSIGIFIPISGWFADRYGIKPIYSFAIIIFLMGSIGCGIAINVPMLVAFRIIQGIGGAFLTPVSGIIILRIYGTKNFTQAASFVAVATGLAMTLGPLLGGGLTTWFSWRWIFYINIPFGLVGLWATYHFMPTFDKPTQLASLDVLGFLCIGLGLAFSLLLFDVLVEPNIAITWKISMGVASFLCFAGYRMHSKKIKNPLINPQLLKNKTFILTSTCSLVIRLAIATPPFLIPLLLQVGYHYNALQAGLFMIPAALGITLFKQTVKPLTTLVGTYKLWYILSCINAVILFSFSLLSNHFSNTLLIVLLFAYGGVLAIQSTVMNLAIYQSVPNSLHSQAAPYNSAIVQLSSSFAVAIAALIIIIQLSSHHLYNHIPLSAFKHTFQFESIIPLLSLLLMRKKHLISS